jgi:ATPase subunit of ABC transporter with duplicated ATPase domains
MLTVTNLTKTFGPQTLFEDASFQFNDGQRVGLVGANGSGKSTLLQIMAGREEPSSGQVSMPRKARLGFLDQDHYKYEDTRILDVVMMGHKLLWDAMQEREEILANAHETFDTDRYAELEDVVVRYDGYSLEARAGEILAGLNIPIFQHEEPLSVLSGGFKLRALLAQTLAAEPDVLFLDEPTNHLDIISIKWLEDFLQSIKGIVVVVSHDRRFLDAVCTHIVDLDYEKATLYTGNYSAFEDSKIAHRHRQETEIGKQEKEIAVNEAFIRRFKAKASKARQAQSRVKRLEKITVEKLAPSSRRFPTFKIPSIRPPGKKVLTVENVTKAFDDNLVLCDVSLTVNRGDRLAIIGPNGIGKSTLLKIAMKQLEPDEGMTEWGHEAYPGYFAQDHHELLGDRDINVHNWLWDFCPMQTIGYVRSNLAMVLFGAEDVEKSITNLSGGEAARLIFARLAVLKPNILILDEPTNHLDIEGVQALSEGLKSYEGTIIFVSHDRWFVSELATRIVEITHEGLEDYKGSYEEFMQRASVDHLDTESVLEQAKVKKRATKKKNNKYNAGG